MNTTPVKSKKATKPKYEFKVKLDHYESYFNVYIYENRQSIAKGIINYCRNILGEKSFNLEGEIYGIVLGIPAVKGKDDFGLYRSDCFASMFLNEEDLDVYTIFHECLHTALMNESKILRFDCQYIDENNSFFGENDEERLTYKQNDYAMKIIDFLLDKGINVSLKRNY